MTGNQAYGPQKKCLQAIWTSIGSLSIFYWVRAGTIMFNFGLAPARLSLPQS